MTLLLEDAPAQLLVWGLLNEADLVEDDLTISSISRRNLNLRLERRRGPGFLIKQPDPTTSASRRTLRAECRFYTFCAEEPRAAAVARRMPRLHAGLPEEDVLAIRWAEGSRSLWDAFRIDGSSAAWSALGEALGTLHATFPSPGLADDPRLGDLWHEPPSIFTVHRPRPSLLRRLGPAQQELLRLVQGEPTIRDGLDTARAAWRVDTLIHGDIRSDNVLVLSTDSQPGEILLIDWEMVQRGDPAYDIGSVLASCALFWLYGMPLEAELEAGPRVAAARWPLATLHPALDAFRRAYMAATELDGVAAGRLLHRAVSCSAAVLVMSAWEHAHGRLRLTSLVVLLLQLAANVFADPARQARLLYGIQLSDERPVS